MVRYVGEELIAQALVAVDVKSPFSLFSIRLGVGVWLLMYWWKDNPSFRVFPEVYWAVTTMTTVGYGDVAPVTDLGEPWPLL